MDADEKRIRKYESALNLLFYEGEIAWQLNLVFIALNVGVAALVGSELNNIKVKPDILLAIYGFLGLFITLLWLGTFNRNNRYYRFRIAQAREAEPEEWQFLRIRGYKFSHGEKIVIDSPDIDAKDKDHQLSFFENKVSNKSALKWAIYLIIIAYIVLILFSFFSIHVIVKIN